MLMSFVWVRRLAFVGAVFCFLLIISNRVALAGAPSATVPSFISNNQATHLLGETLENTDGEKLGKIKDLVIATKGGLTRPGPGQWVPNGRPEYLTRCVENSLKRLQLERIDLYQLHRIDPKVPMEESLGALKKMQEAGKIRHIGLSEVSAEEIDRARKVLPIVSVQNQYNIGNRKWEKTLTYCEKEGLGFMPWSPIGGNRGLKDNALEAAARDYHASVVQLALAWLLHRSPAMLPIPGTSSVAHLEENMAAAKLKLTAEDWKRVDALAS